MRRTPSRLQRALALFLACQPALWMSNVAYAQAVNQGYEPPRQDGRGLDFQAGDAGQQLSPQQLQQLQQGGQGAFGSFPQSGAGAQQVDAFSSRFDCVVLDLDMPNVGGAEVVNDYSGSERMPVTPITAKKQREALTTMVRQRGGSASPPAPAPGSRREPRTATRS